MKRRVAHACTNRLKATCQYACSMSQKSVTIIASSSSPTFVSLLKTPATKLFAWLREIGSSESGSRMLSMACEGK